MTGAEDYLNEIIRLQLKKPRNWNWELSTSKSSPHIALPTIQLYDTKGQLLVETNDNGTTNRQSWNSSQNRERSKDRESARSGRNSAYLQRCRSDNLEKRMAQYRASIGASTRPTLEIEAAETRRQPKTVRRSLSNTIVVPSLQVNAVNQPTNVVKTCRSRSKETKFDKLSEKYNPERNEKSSGGLSDCVKSNKGKLGKFGQLVEGMKNDKRGNEDVGGIYRLQKSRSDVLDIKVKSKVQHTLSDKQPIRPYHRRSDSDDLLQKTRQKYNIKESLKRAEHDGYKKFIYGGANLTGNYREKSMEKRERSLEKKDESFENGEPDNNGEKKRRLIGCLATAETVLCNTKPMNFEINNVAKPKKYRLRQSRAGILVISDESFSSTHRRRCHGDFGDCRTDSNDIIIGENKIDDLENIAMLMEKSRSFRYGPQRSRSEKDKADARRTVHNVSSNNSSRDSRHFRQSSDPAGVKTAKFPPNQYRRPQHTNDVSNNVERTDSTRNTFLAKRNPKQEDCLFPSKSDVFLFQKLFNDKSSAESYNIYGNENPVNYTDINDNALTLQLDDNCNYIVQEPLTTPGSESDNKNICDSIIASEQHVDKRLRTKVRGRSSDRCPWITRNETVEAPLIRTPQPRRSGDCDLFQLVRQLSSSQADDDPKDDPRFQKNGLKSFQNVKSSKSFNKEAAKDATNKGIVTGNGGEDDDSHVIGDMGANVSRPSTKGLSGRRSQSSGSICNGKGRHQGDGSAGKGSGGSLPSYLDERESTCNNNYHDEGEKEPLDEVERIPPLGDGAPLHWKFSDAQTALCQDQGYGSERSPEEEYPPPLPDQDLEQCHHHLEAHSCYPFITPESTFSVKLAKGSRGLGLSVTGGIDSAGSWPGLVRIKRLFPHQPASACGLLNVGDLLLEANGVPLTGLTNYEALEVLRTAANQVELRVCRPPPDVLNCVSPISEVPPPPPTRREPPNSLNLSTTYYGSTPDDEYYHGEFEVILTKIQGSLGFTLRKEDDSALGHYVRALVREPALTDGRIQAGDKIIAVNDVEISAMTHEQAVQYLRQCGDNVKLRLYRDSAQTPVAALSPTETTPRTSFSKKANLRQEAVDMLNDIAVRKLIPGNPDCTARRSLSPTSSPRRLRRHNHPSDASQESCTKYLIPEEQFHEGMLKCSHFDEDAFNSLFTIDNEDMDRPSRPNSLDLYNPNQTPVAARKPRFNFSLAHNAYELNNLDPEVLDAPNLTYNLGNDEAGNADAECGDSFPREPASMPHIPLDISSAAFSYKNPAYQSAHPPCVESDARSSSSASKSSQNTQKEEETDTIKRKKGILKKDTEKRVEKSEPKTETQKMTPMKEDYEMLAIELNRGWNSRLGFSLQGAAGVTYVSAVHADSVAAKDGRIKPGDRVIKVNDESVEHLSTAEIIDLLRIVRGPVCIVVKRIKSNEDCPKSNAEN